MLRIGIVGFGMMGRAHFDAYRRIDGVAVTAIADRQRERIGRDSDTSNIEGVGQAGVDVAALELFDDGSGLIRDGGVDIVDVCVETPAHLPLAREALGAGKHVMVEKPLARTSAEALAFAAEAEAADRQVMCGMCMRFWPGWTWLKRTIDEQPWGRVLGATFRRVGGVPGSPFYRQGERSGGAILDLHLHDTDFVRHCFGVPATVTSTGYTRLSGEIDHVVTRYGYGADGPMVVAEGAWIEADGVAFDMRFEVVFERAVARYALGSETPLWLYRPGAPPQVVEVEATLGHEAELAYFVDCVRAGRSPEVVTLREAAESIAIVEHEVRSVRAGGPVEVVLA